MSSSADSNGPIRAPSENGQVLSVPSLKTVAELVSTNARRLSLAQCEIGGKQLPEFRSAARAEIVERARKTAEFLSGSSTTDIDVDQPLIVTGHQPQLIHPGVWAKNIAASRLATQVGGVGLNLIVDNDVVSRAGIFIPTGTRERPRLESILYDAPQPACPWEEWKLQDVQLFGSFGSRITQSMHAWGIEPIAADMWPDAISMLQDTDNIVDALSACRVRQERRWDIHNLELKISELSRTQAFSEFVTALFLDHERFFSIYNESVEQYRVTNGVRNDRHPVPNLKRVENRFEMPFWFWKHGRQTREPVFVESRGSKVMIHLGDEKIACSNAGKSISDLPSEWCFRPRALTTTMFARLAFADLFVHGIGGAKYDEVTDQIIAGFFDIEPPGYQTLTATLHLLEPYPVGRDDEHRLHLQERDYAYNPERLLKSPIDDATIKLINQKQQLISKLKSENAPFVSGQELVERRHRQHDLHTQIKAVNSKIRERLGDFHRRHEIELNRLTSQLQANRVLASREFASILFDKQSLRTLFDPLLERSASE